MTDEMCITNQEKEIDFFPKRFKFSYSQLPELINTREKWINYVMGTHSIERVSQIIAIIKLHSNPDLTEKDKELITNSILEDIVSMHGVAKFVPSGYTMEED